MVAAGTDPEHPPCISEIPPTQLTQGTHMPTPDVHVSSHVHIEVPQDYTCVHTQEGSEVLRVRVHTPPLCTCVPVCTYTGSPRRGHACLNGASGCWCRSCFCPQRNKQVTT